MTEEKEKMEQEEQGAVVPQETIVEPSRPEGVGKRILTKVRKCPYIEAIVLVLVMITALNLLFGFSLTITRRTLLRRMLGEDLTVGMLPPKIAADGMHVQPMADIKPADPGLVAEVLPGSGVELPVKWGALGKKMVADGVIDKQKFQELYAQRGGISADMNSMLTQSGNGTVKLTPQNSGMVLNMLWALGLSTKNTILEKGEMQDTQYASDPGKFAPTGGWTLSSGATMDHFSRHAYIRLNASQQALVERVSKNVFRPCCKNPTHFPDCNHGMAMLALLELMASQGVSESNMYKYALAANTYWFPDNYLTIASYYKKQNLGWNDVQPKEVLSAKYSSSQGYNDLVQKVSPVQAPKSAGGCGV